MFEPSRASILEFTSTLVKKRLFFCQKLSVLKLFDSLFTILMGQICFQSIYMTLCSRLEYKQILKSYKTWNFIENWSKIALLALK